MLLLSSYLVLNNIKKKKKSEPSLIYLKTLRYRGREPREQTAQEKEASCIRPYEGQSKLEMASQESILRCLRTNSKIP